MIDDGQAQSRAAALGREVGQEQLFLLVGRDAAAGVGDDQFDGFRARPAWVVISRRFTSESCMASAALSTRFTTTRWNCSLSMFTGGKSAAKLHANVDAIQPAVEHRQRALHHLIQIAAHRLRGGEAGELRELVDQRLHRFHRARNGAGAFVAGCGCFPAECCRRSNCRLRRSAESAMGVSGFLISCATRRATSCQAAAFWARSSSLVSSSTITKPEVQLLLERRNGDGQVQGLAFGLHLQLARSQAGAARALHQVFDLGRVFAREQVLQPRGALATCAAGNMRPSARLTRRM